MKNTLFRALSTRLFAILLIATPFWLSSAWPVTAAPNARPSMTTVWTTATISTPVTWTAAASPYWVQVDVTVQSTGSLTIEPGVVVKFSSGRSLTMDGPLVLQSALGSEIIFTSYRDDSYGGDDNGDGASVGARGDWRGITLRSPQTSFSYARVRFAQSALVLYANSASEQISPVIQNVVLEETSQNGLLLNPYSTNTIVSPTISNSQFIQGTGNGVSLQPSSTGATTQPSLQNVTVANNGYGLYIQATSGQTAQVNAQNVDIHHNTWPVYLSYDGVYNDLGGNNIHDNTRQTIAVSGTLYTNHTWTAIQSLPYFLDNTVTVYAGATLTLPAGLVVKADSSSSLVIDGNLILQGTSGNEVIFTSYRDDSYVGDTYGDGATVGARGDWAGITLRSPDVTTFAYARVRFATTALTIQANGASESLQPTISNVILEESSQNGLYAYPTGTNSVASPRVQNTTILNNTNAGLAAVVSGSGASASPQLSGVVLSNNRYGVYAEASTGRTAVVGLENVEIHHNTWPVYFSYNGWMNNLGGLNIHDNTYSAVGVSGTLYADRTWSMVSGMAYWMDNSVTVNTGVTLTLAEGLIVKADSSVSLIVEGTLVSQGTEAHPVVFTSYRDDSIGGNSNGDGVTVGARGDWTGLSIRSSSTPSLSRVRVRYASTALEMYANNTSETISPALQYLVLEESSNYGLFANAYSSSSTVSPILTGCELANNLRGIYAQASTGATALVGLENISLHHNNWPVTLVGNAWVNASGAATIVNNTHQAIVVQGTLSVNRTWSPVGGMPYWLDGSYTINAGATLSIPAGVLVKAGSGSELLVEGTLDLQGDANNPVTFTSYRDDSIGGDTNGDGATTGSRGDWYGISIRSASTATIGYARIRFASTGLMLYAQQASEIISPLIQQVVIEESYNYGLYAYAYGASSVVSPTLQNTQITGTRLYAIYTVAYGAGSTASPSLNGVTLSSGSTGIFASALSGTTVAPSLANVEVKGFTYPLVIDSNAWFQDLGGLNFHENTYPVQAIHGTLASSRTMTPLATLTLLLDSDLTVAAGATLTLPAGTLMKSNSGGGLIIDGTLVTQGSADHPVILTSYRDDAYGGDTNGDGLTTGTRGDWDGVTLRGPGTTQIQNTVIRFASYGIQISAQNGNTLAPVIQHNDIRESYYEGIRVYAYNGTASPQILSNVLTSNPVGVGISVSTGGVTNPVIQSNDIYGNQNYGIRNQNAAATISAENNWWGDSSGPYHATANPTGLGNAISDYVTFSPPSPTKFHLGLALKLTPSLGLAPLNVTFAANPAGGTAPYSYQWSFGTGDTSTEAEPTYQYANVGVYNIQVIVASSDGQTASAQSSIEVRPPLTVGITATPASGNAPLSVALQGSVSGGISPYTYQWDLDEDGQPESTSQNLSYTFNLSTTVVFTAVDSLGNSKSTTQAITVTQPFSVTMLANPLSGYYPLTVDFSGQASGSTGPYTYEWDLNGDGSYEKSGATVQNIYQEAGSFRATLRARNNAGVYAYTSSIITVRRPPLTLYFMQLDASKFPIVEARVRAVGEDRKSIAGLTANSFTLTEQSEREAAPTSEVIDVQEQTGQGGGIAVALVMDISGSMAGSGLTAAKTAANEFINNLGPLDRAAIIAFGSSATLVQSFSNDPVLLHNAVNSLATSGSTAMYNGVYQGIDQCNTQTGVRAVVMFTDGGDNASSYTAQQTIDHANETGIPVFTIGVGSISDTPLITLANATGAYYTPAPSADDLSQIYADIAALLQNHYLITYQTHNPAFDNTRRTVTITGSYNSYSTSVSRQYQVIGAPEIYVTPETIEYMKISQPQGVAIPITVEVRGQNISAVTLYYRKTADGGRYTTLSMAKDALGNYLATVPAADVTKPGIDFYVEATNGTVTASDPQLNPSSDPYQISVIPNNAPQILHAPIHYAPPGNDLIIQAEVTDTTDYLTSVQLHYREYGRVIFEVADMGEMANHVYQAILPKELLSQNGVEYYLTATDNFNITSYHGTPRFPHLVSTTQAVGWNLTPVMPANDQVPSTVEQGGLLLRTYQVTYNGAPAANRVFRLNDSQFFTTNAEGLLVVAISSTRVGIPGASQSFKIDYVLSSGRYEALPNAPTFTAQVVKRKITSNWSVGAGVHPRVGGGGASTGGAYGYIEGGYDGSMDIELQEFYPLQQTDGDLITITAGQNIYIGGGVGYGEEAGVKIGSGPVNIGPYAEANVEVGVRGKTMSEIESQFDAPYSSQQVKAEAVTALIGLYHASGKENWLLREIIARLLPADLYKNYRTSDTTGMGVEVLSSGEASVTALQFTDKREKSKANAKFNLGITNSFSSSLGVFSRFSVDPITYQLQSLSLEQSSEFSVSSELGGEVPDAITAKLSAEVGACSVVNTTLEFENNTMEQVSMTMTGGVKAAVDAGIDISDKPVDWGVLAGHDVNYEISDTFIIPRELIEQAGARIKNIANLNSGATSGGASLVVGPDINPSDLIQLIKMAGDGTFANGIQYEKWMHISTGYQPDLSLEFALEVRVKLSGNASLQWGKDVLLERGVIYNGRIWIIEKYSLDQYVSAPERDLNYIIGNALKQAWQGIANFFSVTTTTIIQGAQTVGQTVISTVSNAANSVVGSFTIWFVPGQKITQFTPSGTGETVNLIADGATINLTVVGYTELYPSGQGDTPFVVGGVYSMLPDDLAVAPAADVALTYRSEDLAGRDAAKLAIFRRDAGATYWKKLPSQVDAAAMQVKSQTDRTGTFVIGYDTLPPDVVRTSPSDGKEITSIGQPVIVVYLKDEASGIDPNSIVMTLDGMQAKVTFDNAADAAILKLDNTPSTGWHTVYLSAADGAGNLLEYEFKFISQVAAPDKTRIFIPVVSR